jgi:hypothetical protein
MVLTQEDCMMAHRAEKKRKTPTGPSNVQSPRYRVVPNAQFTEPQRNAPSSRSVFRPPQPQGGYRPPVPPQQPQQFGLRPNNQQFQQKSSTNRCFNCGSADHFIKDCPRPRKPFQGQGLNQNNQDKGKKRVMQVRQGRVNFTTIAELPEGAPIMTGTFSIDYKPVIMLFDSSASYSFISDQCVARVRLDSCQAKGSYIISTPGGRSVPIN